MGTQNKLYTKRIIFSPGQHKKNEKIDDDQHTIRNGYWKGRPQRTHYQIHDPKLLKGFYEQLSGKRFGT